MSWIKLILDEASDNGRFADILIAYEDYFKFDHIFLISGIADLFVLSFHNVIVRLEYKL